MGDCMIQLFEQSGALPMAKRRRLVDSYGEQPRALANRTKSKTNLKSSMSSDDSFAASIGHSSDGTPDERRRNGARASTVMTSVMDTDENVGTDEDDAHNDDDDEEMAQQHFHDHPTHEHEHGSPLLEEQVRQNGHEGEGQADTMEEHLGVRDEADSGEFETFSIYPTTYIGGRKASEYDSTLRPEDRSGYQDLSSVRSLWAQDLDYRLIHGRRYCREYFMPNDEVEQLRLALLHQVYLQVLEGELTTAPLEDPTRILDVGTGTGDWAMKMGELYPQCEVVGTDISAIAETRGVPLNVFFEIEDAEDWDRPPDFYDLIHLRNMEGAFKDWPYLYENMFFSLKPGGWIELLDFDTPDIFTRWIPHFPADSPIGEIFTDTLKASEKAGYLRGVAHLEPRLLIDAGFVDVRVVDQYIPVTLAERTAGKIWLITCLDAVEALCLRILTEKMGWDPERCKAACEISARQMAEIVKKHDGNQGLHAKVRIVTGRKPMQAFKESGENFTTAETPTPPSIGELSKITE